MANTRTAIISYYSSTNAYQEWPSSSNATVYLPLYDSFHDTTFIGGDMKTVTGKDEKNKYSTHISSNRNRKYLTDFLLKSRLACHNTKSPPQKKKKKEEKTMELHLHK